MIAKIKRVVLDGRTNGVVVETQPTKNNSRCFIYSKQDYIRLFKNINIAKVTAKSIVGNEIKLTFHFYLEIDGVKYDFLLDNCQKVGKHWEIFHDGILFHISEEIEYAVSRIGYFVFDDGDTVRCNKEYGIKRLPELMNYIDYISVGILNSNEGKYGLSKVVRDNNNEIVLHLKGTTGQIHILSNPKLMDINQSRKAVNNKCLSFNKNMDKYTTLYCYASKDRAETTRIGSDEIIDVILGYILEDLNTWYGDSKPKFEPLEFTGYINILED